ncbi:cytochrome b [Pseudomonas petrae]|uniref:Cytochrome b/b6 domain-containing protein n=1 Tax=Pseudomonas petrae TaxID=2912190 RepID=A0ABS9I7Z4_9PSED|nr:cytochrome b/b6 domain-containing protein [Pseudomonas petrae]MCF7531384.1 cytochrome b/b6 domain-containing protein [Pseudomonas petrae]MCF7536942.1 cytochrome b/b6 domain-containing protein [Pseudomonas petrae]MCF7543879.1 cytochrome b/b6 domain-containing protein [Pseudomonas petrae]MCF7557722.1 cytochrome b/b6 domain-containing protein [Pseudomonas petrae]
MTLPNTPLPEPASGETSAYSRTRIFLHWLSAAVILWATFSGFGVALLDQSNPIRQWVESFNPQLTSLFIPFFVWRLWLAVKAPSPSTAKNVQARLASAAHNSIYGAVAGVLITGVLMMSHPVMLLALVPLPQFIHSKIALLELHQVHRALCAALAGLMALHLAAVVLHQVRGKSVLGRMRGTM